MTKKIFIIIVLLAVAIGAALFIQGRRTDAERIRDVFASLVEAVDEEDTDAILGFVAPDYEDSMGITRDEIASNLPRAFFGSRTYKLAISDLSKFTNLGRRAYVNCTATVQYLPDGKLIAAEASAPVKVTLVKRKSRWRIQSVAGVEDFRGIVPG